MQSAAKFLATRTTGKCLLCSMALSAFLASVSVFGDDRQVLDEFYNETAGAETQIFQDAVFPYRIRCKPDWVQEIKNDSMFQLKTTDSGKKTRLQLKRYALDTNSSREIMDWARVNFAVNSEIARKRGMVISSDSGIKIGDLRAFELCALYLQIAADDSLWWGELSRWTEYRSYGYSVAVISDTADLLKNLVGYQELLDSVSITAGTSAASQPHPVQTMNFTSPGPAPQGETLHDLLGRKYTRPGFSGTQLHVQRHRKRLIALEPGHR